MKYFELFNLCKYFIIQQGDTFMIVARGATRLSHKFRVPLLSPSFSLSCTYFLSVCVCAQPAGHSFCCCCCCFFCLGLLFCLCYQANRSSAKVRNNKISKFAFGHFGCCCCTGIIGLMCTPYLAVPFPLPHLLLFFLHSLSNARQILGELQLQIRVSICTLLCLWHVACGSCQPRSPSLSTSLSILLTFEFEFKHNTQIHTLLNLN